MFTNRTNNNSQIQEKRILVFHLDIISPKYIIMWGFFYM